MFKLFLYYIEDDVQWLAVDLLVFFYEYSENWVNKWEIFLNIQKMFDENFVKDSFFVMKWFWFCKFNCMIMQNVDQFKVVMEKGEGDYMVYLKLD